MSNFFTGPTPRLFAHRGASGEAPENTLAAFQRAATLGVVYMELDVHLSRDGQVVVIHDETLERTTNGHGLVRQHSLAELQGLDAGWSGSTAWPNCKGSTPATASLPTGQNVSVSGPRCHHLSPRRRATPLPTRTIYG